MQKYILCICISSIIENISLQIFFKYSKFIIFFKYIIKTPFFFFIFNKLLNPLRLPCKNISKIIQE